MAVENDKSKIDGLPEDLTEEEIIACYNWLYGLYDWLDEEEAKKEGLTVEEEAFDETKPDCKKSKGNKHNRAIYDVDEFARRHAELIMLSSKGLSHIKNKDEIRENDFPLTCAIENLYAFKKINDIPDDVLKRLVYVMFSDIFKQPNDNNNYYKLLRKYLGSLIKFSESGRKPIEKQKSLSPEDYIIAPEDNSSFEDKHIAEEIEYCYCIYNSHKKK